MAGRVHPVGDAVHGGAQPCMGASLHLQTPPRCRCLLPLLLLFLFLNTFCIFFGPDHFG